MSLATCRRLNRRLGKLEKAYILGELKAEWKELNTRLTTENKPRVVVGAKPKKNDYAHAVSKARKKVDDEWLRSRQQTAKENHSVARERGHEESQQRLE